MGSAWDITGYSDVRGYNEKYGQQIETWACPKTI